MACLQTGQVCDQFAFLQVNIIHFMFVTTDDSGPSPRINTTDNQICVSCPDDGVSKGCVVVFRPPHKNLTTMSHHILRSEVKCFRQQQIGNYTVAVFKQAMSNALQAIPLKVSVVFISNSSTRKSTM